MSLDSSTNLLELLNTKFDHSEDKNSKIVRFIQHYKKDQWINPGVVERNYNTKIEDVYRLLEELEKLEKVEGWYKYCCGHCKHSIGVVRHFNELPNSIRCEICGSKTPTLKNTRKIYKVL